MALDLSPDRYGSKPLPQGAELTAEEILSEAERIAQVRKDAKIIAQEIIKELDKRDAAPIETITETRTETNPTESTAAIVVETQDEDSISYMPQIVPAVFGFLIGILVTWLFFRRKIQRLQLNRTDSSSYDHERSLLHVRKK